MLLAKARTEIIPNLDCFGTGSSGNEGGGEEEDDDEDDEDVTIVSLESC